MSRWPAPSLAMLAVVSVGLAACTYTKDEDDAVDAPTDETAVPGEPVPSAGSVTTTTAEPTDLASLELDLLEVAELESPVALAARAGDPALYVAQQSGEVRRIEITTRRNSTTTTVQSFQVERTDTLDLSDEVTFQGEQGLLGLTFSPDGNRLYAAFTGTDEDQHLVEFTMDGETADEDTRRDLLDVPDFAPDHNGGMLAFGPDGFLYWGMGDGGGRDDPEASGQDPTDLLGSILRIDPDVDPDDRDRIEYAIPEGNPFAEDGGAPEVWAYGLRNPWRFSFDRATGDLWIGDVGQGEVEEIDLLPATDGQGAGRAANLGWSEMEGDEPFRGGTPDPAFVEPIHTYGHNDGDCSVVGGYVYRGTRIPDLAGVYLFADSCEGQVRGLLQRDGTRQDQRGLDLEVPSITSFGEDPDGELYVLSAEGAVYRIVAAGTARRDED